MCRVRFVDTDVSLSQLVQLEWISLWFVNPTMINQTPLLVKTNSQFSINHMKSQVSQPTILTIQPEISDSFYAIHLTMVSIASSSFTSFSHFSGQALVIDAPHSSSSISYRPISVSASCTSTVDRPRVRIETNPSLYDVLGIHSGATCQEIKTAYRRLARVVHPDVTASNGQQGQTSADEFMKVHEAYATLSDAQKRADYDRMMLFRRPRPVSSSFSMSSSYGRRWETDQCW